MDDECMKYKTIPQFSHTCWFNGILHVILYSKLLRKTVYNHIISLPDFSKRIIISISLFFAIVLLLKLFCKFLSSFLGFVEEKLWFRSMEGNS